MNSHRSSSKQQQQHSHRQHRRHRHHQQPTKQEIYILMDKNTNQFQVTIKSDGPIDTTVVVDPAAAAATTINSPSSPSPSPSPPPHPTFSSSGWNSPVNPTVPDLLPPPQPIVSSSSSSKFTIIHDEPLDLSIIKKEPFELQ